MTFKEMLVEQAERASEINIEEEMSTIKAKLAEHADERAFTISLIKSKTNWTFLTGYREWSKITLLIPKGCYPYSYRQQFVDALLGLGFTEDDISFDVGSTEVYDYYNIKVTW
jgi:hypothetical protein